MRRIILTGAPGAGKTTLIQALAERGHAVVEEAATEVNAIMIAGGVAHPSAEPDFIERIVKMQRERRLTPSALLQFHDRSPICTLALCQFLSLPEPPSLAAELDEIDREGFYERRVLFVDNLGFMTPTEVRRISFEFAAVRGSPRAGLSGTWIRVGQGSSGAAGRAGRDDRAVGGLRL